jgi:hypothetical protein
MNFSRTGQQSMMGPSMMGTSMMGTSMPVTTGSMGNYPQITNVQGQLRNNQPVQLMNNIGQPIYENGQPIYVSSPVPQNHPISGLQCYERVYPNGQPFFENGQPIYVNNLGQKLDPRTGQPNGFFSNLNLGSMFGGTNGGKKRRTHRRKQCGGCNGYSSSSIAFNAAPFTGGRRSRRRKSHKKRGKRSHRR